VYSDILTGDLSDKRFYGVYRGVVADSNDPDNLGKLKLQVPQILGSAVTSWAWPVIPAELSFVNPTTTQGITDSAITIDSLEPGSGVWVMFEGGDPNFPLWIGRF